MTMLLVEQNLRQALRLADKGYVLRRGEVVMSGAAKDRRVSTGSRRRLRELASERSRLA